jgi:uncharacterized protein
MRNSRWLPTLLLLFAVTTHAETVAKMPAPTGYIDDYAAVLSAPAKSEMEALCRELHDKTKAQVFVVTIKTLEGTPVESFANDLFRKWKIGEKKTDRGVLILFAINDHKDRIEVGYGLEAILNDAKVGDIGREMVPDLKASHYDDAIRTGLQDVSKVIATDANVTLDALAPDTAAEPLNDQPPPPVDGPPVSSGRPGGAIILFLLPFVFFGSLIAYFVWWIRKGIRSGTITTGGSSSDGGSSFSSSDSSSDSSSSSSDDSFSGGDGGDSGGGGSSGSW